LNFGTNFTGTPTVTSLGNIGSLNYPNAFYPVNDNGNWTLFVANNGDNSLSRIDFGASLLNTPTGINLGNPGGVLNTPSDLHIFNNCGQYAGYLVNGGNNTLIKLSFTNLGSSPSAFSLGNIGNMSAPHSISRAFRIGADTYAFAVNLGSNSLTRLKFAGCNNSSVLGSNLQNPPPITFNSAGAYNITLVVNEGLSSQSSFCKKVIVIAPPVLSISSANTICQGDTILLQISGAANYSWSPAAGLSNTNIYNPLASPTTTTKYYVTGFDVAGCTKKDSIVVTVNPRPVISKISDTAKCDGSAGITLFASSPGAIQYTWSPAAGLSNASIANPIANPANTKTYYVQVTGSNGCKNIDSVKLSVLPVPSVSARPDTTLCSGASVLLTTTSSGATGFSWSPVTGLSNPNIANPVASPTTFTRYTVVASNSACTANAVVNIDVLPLPVVTKSNDTTICNEGQAQLSISGGNAYSWSPASGLSNPNISNPVASPATATRYYVNVTGSNGCKRTDSVMVNWIPKPVFTVTPITAAICAGDSILLTAAGADTYNWFGGSNITSIANGATYVRPSSAEQYSVAMRHNFCKIIDTLHSAITVNNLPVVSVTKSNDIDCSNASATLTATGGVTYNWSPSTNIAAANTASPVVSPLTSTTYIVKVTNNSGCIKYDSVKVNVVFNPLGSGYNVPDAFTPNNDKKNDCFGIKYWGAVQSFDLVIFNRWGDMIFHTTDPLGCWDGNYKGIPQATGTFVYQIKAKTACGDVYKKGTILLIR
jgi:gliding motility-associated-like protein